MQVHDFSELVSQRVQQVEEQYGSGAVVGIEFSDQVPKEEALPLPEPKTLKQKLLRWCIMGVKVVVAIELFHFGLDRLYVMR